MQKYHHNKNSLIEKMVDMHQFHLLLLTVVIAIILTEISLVPLSIYFHGRITHDYLISGLITAFFVALVVVYIPIYLIGQVREREELFKGAFETSAIGMAIASLDGQWLQVNPSLCEIVGYSEQELTAKTFQDITHPDDLQADLEYVKRLVAGEIPYYRMEKRYLHKQGYPVVILLSVSLVREVTGGPLYFVKQMEDITERRRADDALRASEAKMNAITFSANDSIIMMDDSGAIVFWNRAAETLFGYSADEAIGKNLHEFLAPERYLSDYRHAFSRWQETGEGNAIGKTLELFALRKERLEFEIELSLSSVKINGRWMAIGMIRDITARKRAEKELKIAKVGAEEANRLKSDFLATMSHEIRTPMNAIIGMADLLGETPLNEEQQKYIDVFRNAGENLLSIINDILDLSKIEAGHLSLEETCFDLNDLLEQTCEIAASRAHDKGLEFACHIKPDVPVDLMGDPGRMRQVVMNLAGNAIKFTETGEIVISVEKLRSDGDRSVSLLFSVRDTGIGIPSEIMDMVFEKFTQADTSTTRKYGGTGLGLPISKLLVELMRGNIWVESTAGKGTTFYFSVPFKLQPEYKKRIQPLDEPALMGLETLIIDDNSTNRMILREMLAGWGIIVSEADGGEKGIAKLRKKAESDSPIKDVLLDYRMPGMDGLRTAEIIKADPLISQTVIIMITSEQRDGDREKFRRLGITGYLMKPVKRVELKNVVLTALGQKKIETVKVPSAVVAAEEQKPLNILLVEDNDDNQLLMKSYLKKTPHNIDIAENGQIAVTKFKTGNYDIVLMDMQMPIMDGYTATAEIRKWETDRGEKRTPVIALTAHALKDDEQKSLGAGCDAHLTKPIKKAILLDALSKYGAEAV